MTEGERIRPWTAETEATTHIEGTAYGVFTAEGIMICV
jgi:hypothetical protein